MPSAATYTTCDVLVVGGGPAGSTISALLAERGLERACVGKGCAPALSHWRIAPSAIGPDVEKIGVLPEIEKIGIIKYGAEMISHCHGRSEMFYFAKAFDYSQPYAFEVKRSEFDAILMKNATAKGAHVHEGLKAQRVEFRPGSSSIVHAEDRDGRPAPGKRSSSSMPAAATPFFPHSSAGNVEAHPQQRGNLRTLRRGDSIAR